MTDLIEYARFHMGDGTIVTGERLLKQETLELMRAPQVRKQSTDDDMGIGWHIRRVGPVRTYSHGGTLGGHILLLEIVPERNFAIAILTNSSTGWRLIQDVEREALKTFLGASYASNQAIAHRGLVETLPTATLLARQPDLATYVGTYARPSNSYVVRAEGGKLIVRDSAHTGTRRDEFPIAFFGPDRAIVTDGNDKGQSIEFVRNDAGRVTWIRVVGRVAARTVPAAPGGTDSGPAMDSINIQGVIYLMEQVTSQVKLSQQPPNLRYPDELRSAGVEGEVRTRFVVSEKGRVEMSTLEVLWSTDPRFIRPVRDWLATARYIPATLRGKPVRQMVVMPFNFTLKP
jgi:TonB family protein